MSGSNVGDDALVEASESHFSEADDSLDDDIFKQVGP